MYIQVKYRYSKKFTEVQYSSTIFTVLMSGCTVILHLQHTVEKTNISKRLTDMKFEVEIDVKTKTYNNPTFSHRFSPQIL